MSVEVWPKYLGSTFSLFKSCARCLYLKLLLAKTVETCFSLDPVLIYFYKITIGAFYQNSKKNKLQGLNKKSIPKHSYMFSQIPAKLNRESSFGTHWTLIPGLLWKALTVSWLIMWRYSLVIIWSRSIFITHGWLLPSKCFILRCIGLTTTSI